MSLNNPFDNRESKAATVAFCSYTYWIDTIKAFKNMGEMLRRNPYSCITNGEKGLVALPLDAKYHLSTCIGIQNSVIKQIHDHLDEACFISLDSNSLVWLYLYRDAMFGG